MKRRDFLQGLACAGLLPAGLACAETAPVTLWGIPASPSAVFARAAATGTVPGLNFDIWKSTDQMRAGIASGAFQLFGTSTYAAANFFNRGSGTRMVNVVTWGVLYIMARDESIAAVEDLAGRKVLLSNKNEAPDLLFRLVLKWSGLDPDRDVELDYFGSPGEAVPLYLSGRGDVAVMHEPAATAALMKATQVGAPLHRAIDITEAYGAHTGRGARIPQVGLAVSPDFLETCPEIVAATHEACAEAGRWVLENPDNAGTLAAATLPLPAEVIARSLPWVHLDVESAWEARQDIEVYLEHLMSLDPAIVGGKLPDPDFYWGEAM